MFAFTIKYFGFLKFVPGLAMVFDAWLKIHTLISKPVLLDWIDDIETRMLSLPGTTTHNHKYGGLQFDLYQTEIGHIHSNGLLDMLLNRNIKARLMQQGHIQDHHSFKNTGWISFYIRTEGDVQYALDLLRLGYDRIGERGKSRYQKGGHPSTGFVLRWCGLIMFLLIAKLLLKITGTFKNDLANKGYHGNACGPCYPLILHRP